MDERRGGPWAIRRSIARGAADSADGVDTKAKPFSVPCKAAVAPSWKVDCYLFGPEGLARNEGEHKVLESISMGMVGVYDCCYFFTL